MESYFQCAVLFRGTVEYRQFTAHLPSVQLCSHGRLAADALLAHRGRAEEEEGPGGRPQHSEGQKEGDTHWSRHPHVQDCCPSQPQRLRVHPVWHADHARMAGRPQGP